MRDANVVCGLSFICYRAEEAGWHRTCININQRAEKGGVIRAGGQVYFIGARNHG